MTIKKINVIIILSKVEKGNEMPVNWEACPIYNKDKKNKYDCPAPLIDMYHFQHCDLSSDKKCGECVHFEGDYSYKEERHSCYGHCYWTIGRICADYRCNCPHFFYRPNDFQWTYTEWIEKELGDFAKSPAPEVRLMRKEKYQEWKKMFDK